MSNELLLTNQTNVNLEEIERESHNQMLDWKLGLDGQIRRRKELKARAKAREEMFQAREKDRATIDSLNFRVVDIDEIKKLLGIKKNSRKFELKSVDIKDYDEEIPYGAKLKLEQADDSGIFMPYSYKVYYPSVVKPKTDPLIVGTTKTYPMVLIAAWWEK